MLKHIQHDAHVHNLCFTIPLCKDKDIVQKFNWH